jgi:hypothetical protein
MAARTPVSPSASVTCAPCVVGVPFGFQEGVWHFRVNGPDKVNYWRKGFDLVLAIAASRKKKRSMMDR